MKREWTEAQLEEGRLTLLTVGRPWPDPWEPEDFAYWYACGWDPDGIHKQPIAPEPPRWKRAIVFACTLVILPFALLAEALEG